jgi:hypothetical protein
MMLKIRPRARERAGLSLAATPGMRSGSYELSHLENAFSILRFRRRGVVSFRRFVVLTCSAGGTANELHTDRVATQPMRMTRCEAMRAMDR